ncbi:MAG: hypothetical protein IT162_14400 [Bryobacterales bacterium]|nr:hypothetical protein [Bryobacterales bacterium]
MLDWDGVVIALLAFLVTGPVGLAWLVAPERGAAEDESTPAAWPDPFLPG